ncbi:tetratricopeptide repeat protein, partial [Planctomycetota bacterium]
MDYHSHEPEDPVVAVNDSFTTAQEKGDCYTSIGELHQARQYYEQAAVLEPDDPRPYIGLGVVALQNDQIDDADIAFRVACRLDPTSSKAYTGLAMIERQRGNLRAAFDYYLKSLDNDADNLTALLGLFQTSCQMGSFAKVIHYLEIYLHTHPQDTSVMFSLAALYVKDGFLENAKQLLSNLIR